MFALGPRSSLFYLPAAVVVLGSLVTPLASMAAIFLGNFAFQSVLDAQGNDIDIMFNSLIPVIASGLAVLMTVYINPRFRDFHSPQNRFSQIDAIDIFYFCVIYATFNVCLSEALVYIQDHGQMNIIPSQIFAMAFGDLTGSFLVFIGLNLSFSAFIRLR